MKIGELAKAAGLSIHTLRYYEKRELIKPARRADTNYRVYTQDHVALLAFIKRCKACGFSLDEIEALVSIQQQKSAHVCEEAKRLTKEKVLAVKAQIESLQDTLVVLEELEAECMGGLNSAENCSIIRSLETDSIENAKAVKGR